MRRMARVITAGLTALALMAQPAALVALDEEQPTPPAVSSEEEASATAEAEEVIAPEEETLAPSDDTELSAEEPGESTELSDEALTPEEPAAESDENSADAAVPQSPEQQLEDDPEQVPADPAREELDQLADLYAAALPDGTYALVSGLEGGRLLFAGEDGSAQLQQNMPDEDALWTVAHDAQGYLTIARASDGKVLAAVLDDPASTAAPGARIELCDPDGTWAQRWIAIAQGEGFVLVSALDATLALDVTGAMDADGASVQLYTRNDTAAQTWSFADPESLEQTSEIDLLAASSRDALPAGTYYIVSSLGSRKVIDVSGGASWDGANVQLYASNGTAAQQWTVSYDANGYATITNKGSGKVLDVAAGKSNPGTNVQQFSSNGTRAQKWVIEPIAGSSSFCIHSALAQNLVLDISAGSSANGANVQVYTANGTAAQSFTFVSAAPVSVDPCSDILPDGWFTIASAANGSYVFDISAASTADGANAQLYQANGTAAQLFRFEYRNGYYHIVNGQSGKALDVDGGSPLPPTNVQQWTMSATNANQQFIAIKNSDGTYSFVNRSSGLALRAGTGSVGNGTNLDAAVRDSSKYQRFTLHEQKMSIAEGLYSLRPAGSTATALEASGQGAPTTPTYRGDASQKWFIDSSDSTPGAYTIESMSSGLKLTATSQTAVALQKTTGSENQQWIPRFSDGAVYAFENRATGTYLSIVSGSGTSARIGLAASPNGSAAHFRLDKAEVLDSGTYTIRLLGASSQVIDISAGSSANGANIQTYASNGTSAQIWDVWKRTDDTYLIKNAANGKALDVRNAQAASGANVQLWQKQNNAAQAWRITFERGVGYRIASALNSSLVLTSTGTSSGSNIMISSDSGAATQRFTLDATDYTPPILNTISWAGAKHWSSGRQGEDWIALVIHISECSTLSQIDNTFWGTREASAHYGVGNSAIHQYVSLSDTAWAVGNWSWNKRTVSIEHVGTTSNPPSRATLDRSAQLMAALARMKQWPELVLGTNAGIHKWYSATTCPASLDVKYLISKANEYMGNGFTYKSVENGAVKPKISTQTVPGEQLSLRDALAGNVNARGF